jgi:hypothetical protein
MLKITDKKYFQAVYYQHIHISYIEIKSTLK